MNGHFRILLEGEILTFERYEDIPESFDNLIEFSPEIIPAPHTPEQHKQMESYDDKLKELLSRETK